jgi:hypothetical protein
MHGKWLDATRRVMCGSANGPRRSDGPTPAGLPLAVLPLLPKETRSRCWYGHAYMRNWARESRMCMT